MNDDFTEKRMAGDYEIIQAVHIGDREVVLGENPQDETGMKYMCCLLYTSQGTSGPQDGQEDEGLRRRGA